MMGDVDDDDEDDDNYDEEEEQGDNAAFYLENKTQHIKHQIVHLNLATNSNKYEQTQPRHSHLMCSKVVWCPRQG